MERVSKRKIGTRRIDKMNRTATIGRMKDIQTGHAYVWLREIKRVHTK